MKNWKSITFSLRCESFKRKKENKISPTAKKIKSMTEGGKV